jgi:putative nucleotidyltransferase with HDIG domain
MLIPNVTLGFDVYLQIADKKLLYIKRDDTIEDSRIKKLVDKNVVEVFVTEKDYPIYLGYLDSKFKNTLRDDKTPVEQKVVLVTAQSKEVVSRMFEEPSKENYKRTEKAAIDQVELLLKTPQSLEALLMMSRHDHSLYQHSVNVATISIGLGLQLKAPDKVCEHLGIGALLHDIGRMHDGKIVAPGNAEYSQHPRLGAGMLQGKNFIPKDVLDIILMHEERLDGKGFPAGVKKLDQIFQVVGLANLMDKMVLFEKKKPDDVIKELLKMDPPPYHPDLIKGLQDVLVANVIY